MLYRPKYKFLIKLRENIWKTLKPKNFKKLKWRKSYNFLYTLDKKKYNKKNILNLKKNKNFKNLKYFKIKNFFRTMLKTKKVFLNTFGTFKKRQIYKLLLKTKKKYLNLKSYELNFNKNLVGNFNYNPQLFLMQMLESSLLKTFTRSRIFSNTFIYKHFIKKGCVLVNNKTILNPHYTLKPGDIISMNFKKNKKFSTCLKIFYLKILHKRKRKLKSNHLIFSFSFLNFKIIFTKYPTFNEITPINYIKWDFYNYLTKLKR